MSSELSASATAAASSRRPPKRPSRLWHLTTMRRAIAEAVALWLAGRALAMVPIAVWPAPLFPLALVLRTALYLLPPVWAAQRVISTRREKMSRRFWALGPLLALCCVLADLVVSLLWGEALLLGGPAGRPDLARLTSGGTDHLALGAFLLAALGEYAGYAIFCTIAVVCARLANGGFMRFTMPAGGGRVTL